MPHKIVYNNINIQYSIQRCTSIKDLLKQHHSDILIDQWIQKFEQFCISHSLCNVIKHYSPIYQTEYDALENLVSGIICISRIVYYLLKIKIFICNLKTKYEAPRVDN